MSHVDVTLLQRLHLLALLWSGDLCVCLCLARLLLVLYCLPQMLQLYF